MKRLFYFFIIAITCKVSAQSFPVKNVNDDYFVSSIYNSTIAKNPPAEFARDKSGMYWLQYPNGIFSFDGANWKSYKLRSLNGSSNPFQINHILATDDGNVWLATENGLFVLDRPSDCFISLNEKFPGIKNPPANAIRFFPAANGTIIYLSIAVDGFSILDLNSKTVKRVIIDSNNKAFILPAVGQITTDRSGNIWGAARDKRGVWHYDQFTGKMQCSWKGELPQFADKRFKSFINLTYSEKENTVWIGHVDNRYLEKMNLTTGKSTFYSFFNTVRVQADTNVKNRRIAYIIRIDRDNNEWLNVGLGKYLVKLNTDISQMEYITNDNDNFPVGDMAFFRTEPPAENDRSHVLFWLFGTDKFSMIRKRGNTAGHIYFDTLSTTEIKPKDFLNTDNIDGTRQKIFFEKGKNNQYFLLQQREGRPKLICFGMDFRIKKVLLNDQWKQYPAYFKGEFDHDTFYVAILRPGTEPLDFRNVVLKDFRIDLNTFNIEEINLDFKQRVWRYGLADKHNVYWLFSNGALYSYNPGRDILDSIYISKPDAKKAHVFNMVKGYDYPTTLHKNSSTFWISFYPARELYKINLETKKVDKIFKPCMDQADCNIPGVVYNIYTFDSLNIYLRSGLHGMLMNIKTDSIINISNVLQKATPFEKPFGVNSFGDWICFVFPSHIYLLNKVTGVKRELLLDEDFKWKIAPIYSKPLVNDHGELILMSVADKGFIVFNVDSPIVRTKPGSVQFAFIKVDDKNLLLDSLMKTNGLTLKYNKYNNIQIAFSDYSVFVPEKLSYEYALFKGNDTNWNKINGKPELTFSDLSSGKYQLLVRSINVYGDYSEKINSFPIIILPPWWLTWWFRGLAVAAVGLIFYGLYRYRVQQLKRLQAIRNNIASDLHDDIGSTLNSISIYSEVAKQQAGKEIPALDLIGVNSRKIIESMSDIVWTINPENDSFEKIIVRMRSFAHQLLKAKRIEYTFEVDEKLNSVTMPMQVRKNFYLVFKESITNLVKYSEASRVSILLLEKNKIIMLRIRDNGKGIPINAQTLGNGLMNMTRRAREIRGELNIVSANGGGTEIELMLKT